MGMLYDWQFVFKASELIELLTKKIERLEVQKLELEPKLDDPPPEDPKVVAALRVLEQAGKIPSRVRLVRDDVQKKYEQLSVEISRWRHVRGLLRREDPHRQFKLTYHDAIELDWTCDD